MDFKRWVEDLPGNPLVTQAAERAGIDRSTMSRQLKRGSISPENVIALARAYGVPAGQALIDTGYLVPADLEGVGVAEALRRATNRQILEEINARVDPDADRMFRSTDDPDVIGPAFTPVDNTIPWAARTTGGASEGARRRAEHDAAGEAPDPDGPDGGA